MKEATVEFNREFSGWSWRLTAANNHPLARSHTTYTRLRDARRGFATLACYFVVGAYRTKVIR